MPFCGQCGTQVNENVNFCPNCGHQLAAAAAHTEPQQAQPVYTEPQQHQQAQSAYTDPQQHQQAQSAYTDPQQHQQAQSAYTDPQQPQQNTNSFVSKVKELNNTTDSTAEFDYMDINQNRVMAVLSYLGILVLVPILAAKESKFARFHANQGLLLLIVDIAYGIVSALLGLFRFTKIRYVWGVPCEIKTTPWFVSLITGVLGLCILVGVIIGVVNAANGKAKELPLIGKFRILK